MFDDEERPKSFAYWQAFWQLPVTTRAYLLVGAISISGLVFLFTTEVVVPAAKAGPKKTWINKWLGGPWSASPASPADDALDQAKEILAKGVQKTEDLADGVIRRLRDVRPPPQK